MRDAPGVHGRVSLWRGNGLLVLHVILAVFPTSSDCIDTSGTLINDLFSIAHQPSLRNYCSILSWRWRIPMHGTNDVLPLQVVLTMICEFVFHRRIVFMIRLILNDTSLYSDDLKSAHLLRLLISHPTPGVLSDLPLGVSPRQAAVASCRASARKFFDSHILLWFIIQFRRDVVWIIVRLVRIVVSRMPVLSDSLSSSYVLSS